MLKYNLCSAQAQRVEMEKFDYCFAESSLSRERKRDGQQGRRVLVVGDSLPLVVQHVEVDVEDDETAGGEAGNHVLLVMSHRKRTNAGVASWKRVS